jgi:hypothetical protein
MTERCSRNKHFFPKTDQREMNELASLFLSYPNLYRNENALQCLVSQLHLHSILLEELILLFVNNLMSSSSSAKDIGINDDFWLSHRTSILQYCSTPLSLILT